DRPIRFWGGLPISAGHLLDGHLSGGHLDHVIPDGHGDGPHLLDEHLRPAAELPWSTRPLYFGARQFGVKVLNQFGNTDGTAPSVTSLVVNAAPRSAEAPAKTGYDAQAQQLTLSFTPSPDL
ncbi:MAG: hypothetical protein V3T70_01135, partial [Phycisphaerae bacterium]